MNNIFGMNFLFGYLIARDRPRNEAFTTGLTASLFPANNLVGPVLLKTQVDKLNDLEKTNATTEEDISTVAEILKKETTYLKGSTVISSEEKEQLNLKLGRFGFSLEVGGTAPKDTAIVSKAK